MASVMVIGSEVFGSCVEEIWVDVGLKNAEALFALLCVFCGWIRRLSVEALAVLWVIVPGIES